MQLVVDFIILLVAYLGLEFVYLTLTADTYKLHFARVQNLPVRSVQFNLWPWGVVCYVLLLLVIWYFVIWPAVSSQKLVVYKVIMSSSLLALAIYGVYNLTNLATFNKYSWMIAFQDIAWGLFVINCVCLITVYCHAKLSNKQLFWK